MNLFTLLASASLALFSGLANAAEPVNTACPIGKEAIAESAGTVTHEGHEIGFCCPGCADAFNAWEGTRKDGFITLAMAGKEPGAAGHAKQAEEKKAQPSKKMPEGDVKARIMHYPIDTCIVAGGKLGSMGEPINHMHEGRLVRFCCAMCTPTFEANPQKYLDELDEKIIEDQRDDYPLDTCAVSGQPLGSMGDPIEYVHNNRLVRLCCAMCEPAIEENPSEHMKKLDKAYADAQRESYPLDTCVVSGAKLGSMGDPIELVAGNRLVRFCCASCVPKFKANPSEFLSKIESE